MKKLVKQIKKIGYNPRIRSRHPSHNTLRGVLPRMMETCTIRFGSITESNTTIEINSIESIKNSSSKLRMKRCFHEGKVKTAEWWTYELAGNIFVPFGMGDQGNSCADLPYPIVAKNIFGSRGEGNTLLHNQAELVAFLPGKTFTNYIFEKFYNYVREYRLHVTADGCFYTCRKMLKSGTSEDAKWFRNDSNCVWIMEENPLFDKPVNWETIISECVKALNACELDFGACDLRVQSATDKKGQLRKEPPDFIVVEINSAPSFGEVTAIKYEEMLPILINKKIESR
jgi:glutathione synthase/RimK-type ligase-like ATP-grasp enzyme